ncbi:unnamed protein product, partial [Ixodes hexagonus]
DLLQLKDAVQRWRHDLSQFTFERQSHREELERLRLHEKLFEDNEKLLRQENASLKTQLLNHCLVVDELKKLRVLYDGLKDDLDDARATMCANGLEFDEKMAEKQREIDQLVRANAQELLACQAAASQKIEAERRAQDEKAEELLKELDAQRAKMKAMEQQHRCEFIALQLERDEQLMQLEGKLRKLQSSGHDVCRQKYAALHKELTILKSRLANEEDDDEVVVSSLEEKQVSNGNSGPIAVFQPSLAKDKIGIHRGSANGNLEDNVSVSQKVEELSDDEDVADMSSPGLQAPPAVMQALQDDPDVAVNEPVDSTAVRASKYTPQSSAGAMAFMTASPVPETNAETLQSPANQKVRPQAVAARNFGSPRKVPPASPAQALPKEKPKRRKLLLEVEDVIFIDAQ